MSILDKYPALWTSELVHGGPGIAITDTNGARVAYLESETDSAERLMLAAPELLEALKDLVAQSSHAWLTHFRSDVALAETMLHESISRSVDLIASIEGDGRRSGT